jgi:hypothetical protein
MLRRCVLIFAAVKQHAESRRPVRAWRKPLRDGKAGPQKTDDAYQQKHRDRDDCGPISVPNVHHRLPETCAYLMILSRCFFIEHQQHQVARPGPHTFSTR